MSQLQGTQGRWALGCPAALLHSSAPQPPFPTSAPAQALAVTQLAVAGGHELALSSTHRCFLWSSAQGAESGQSPA